MGFGELFWKSWQEYRKNFKVFLIIFLLLSVIPSIIYFIVSIPFSLEFLKLGTNLKFSEILSVIFQLKYLIPAIIFGLLVFFLGLLMSASFIYNSLYRKKQMSVKETLIGGKKYFWKYFLFSIVYGIFLMGLFLLFIIPGIIFMIFWIFAVYVLIGENKGILESLKNSYDIVKGKWWHVFGFVLLFGLIILGISIVFSIAGGLINFIISIPFVKGQIPFYISTITQFVARVFNLGANLIIIPLGILFFKNFYLDLRTSMGKTGKIVKPIKSKRRK